MSALVDYVAFTTKTAAVDDVAAFCSFWFGCLAEAGGLLGYAYTWRGEGVVLMHGGASGMGIHVQISGEGCSKLLEHDAWKGWDDFLTRCEKLGAEPRRVDLAFDDFNGLLSLDAMEDCLKSDLYTSRWSEFTRRYGRNRKQLKADILYIGQTSGNSCCCVYNKALQYPDRVPEGAKGWIRCEVRFKKLAAPGVWDWVKEHPDLAGAAGILAHCIKFRVDGPGAVKARKEVASWWSDFLQEAETVKIAVKRVVRTLEGAVQAFYRQHAATAHILAAALKSVDKRNDFWRMLRYHGMCQVTDRHLEKLARWVNGSSKPQQVLAV